MLGLPQYLGSCKLDCKDRTGPHIFMKLVKGHHMNFLCVVFCQRSTSVGSWSMSICLDALLSLIRLSKDWPSPFPPPPTSPRPLAPSLPLPSPVGGAMQGKEEEEEEGKRREEKSLN